MARMLAFILWLSSFLIVLPVAAHDPDTTHVSIERTTHTTANSVTRPNHDEPVRLGEALRSLWSSPAPRKGSKLLVWLRQRAARQFKGRVG
jgi:hypothetical protein